MTLRAPPGPGQAACRPGRACRYGHSYVTDARDDRSAWSARLRRRHPAQRDQRRPGARSAGRRHTIAGRVCMDQFVVDLGARRDRRRAGEVVAVRRRAPTASRPRRTGPTRPAPSATRSSPGSAPRVPRRLRRRATRVSSHRRHGLIGVGRRRSGSPARRGRGRRRPTGRRTGAASGRPSRPAPSCSTCAADERAVVIADDGVAAARRDRRADDGRRAAGTTARSPTSRPSCCRTATA